MPMSTRQWLIWTLTRPIRDPVGWSQTRGAPSPGCAARQLNAIAAEKRGDYEQAALYRACLAPHEWRELGYEKRGNDWVLTDKRGTTKGFSGMDQAEVIRRLEPLNEEERQAEIKRLKELIKKVA